MNRIFIASLLLSLPLVVAAQTPPVTNVRIDTTTTWAVFYVDGQPYTGTANVKRSHALASSPVTTKTRRNSGSRMSSKALPRSAKAAPRPQKKAR